MTRAFVLVALLLAGCAPDWPPPAKPGYATILLVPVKDVADQCGHPKSPWVEFCTLRLMRPPTIVMPLPQDYPGDPYAEMFQEELAHAQRGLPDPTTVRDRLILDTER